MKKLFIIVILILVLIVVVLLLPKKQSVQNIQTTNTASVTPKVTTESNLDLKSVENDLNKIDTNSLDSDLNQLNLDASTF